MDETRSELEIPRVEALDAVIANHSRESLEWIAKLDERVTRTNFLTNGAAAVATLAYIGSGGSTTVANMPLILFTFGTICTGFELRALLKFYAILHKDVGRRRNGWLNDELRVRDIITPKGLGDGWSQLNHLIGWASQLAFVSGVVIGVWNFYRLSA